MRKVKAKGLLRKPPIPKHMDYVPIPRNWYETQYENRLFQRRSFLISDNPTATERYRIKDLLHAVEKELSFVEKEHRYPKTKNEKTIKSPGSQRNDTDSSFETLLFWYRMLEGKLGDYSRKVPVETEFGPRVRIIKRSIRLIVRDASDKL